MVSRPIPSEEPIYLLGTGVLAEEFFAIASDAGVQVAGFVENLESAKSGQLLCGRRIIWVDDLPEGAPCICALSTTRRRSYIEQVASRARFVNLVHPSSVILPGTKLGPGTIVSSGVLIASNAVIGEHVFINRGARIGHHTKVGDFVTIQPGANIAGLVEIGTAAYIGMSATIIERLSIGPEATVAAGAVVTGNVPGRALVAGVPAKVKQRNIEPR